MNFYDFMNKMDQFCLEHQDLDFREMEVRCTRICNVEVFFIVCKDKTECFVLNK